MVSTTGIPSSPALDEAMMRAQELAHTNQQPIVTPWHLALAAIDERSLGLDFVDADGNPIDRDLLTETVQQFGYSGPRSTPPSCSQEVNPSLDLRTALSDAQLHAERYELPEVHPVHVLLAAMKNRSSRRNRGVVNKTGISLPRTSSRLLSRASTIPKVKSARPRSAGLGGENPKKNYLKEPTS